jgi:excisionase family DNA binding protein
LQTVAILIWSQHSTNKGDATSQTALTATEGIKHVLCLHVRTVTKSDAHRLWRPWAHCLDQSLTARSPDRTACCHRARPRNFKARSNVLKQSPELPQFLTIEQAAQRLAINKRTLYREIARGCFPKPIKIRRMARVRVEDLIRYVESLTSDQQAQGGAI